MLTVIRVWAAMAWADGVLAPAEADGLRRLINETAMTTPERVAAFRLLDAPVRLASLELDGLTPEARRGVYRAACRMALVDRDVAPGERAFLERLRGPLGIPDDIAAEIEADLPGLG